MPDREERFRIMLDMVEALVGRTPRVPDLACGTGHHAPAARPLPRGPPAPVSTSTRRCWPSPRAPSAATTGSPWSRPTKDPGWTAGLPYDSYDAVLTATALHWLHAEPLAALYGQIAELVRDGGVFLNADHMIDDTTPRINEAERAQRHARMEDARREGALDRPSGRRLAAADPVLAEPTARRFALYGSTPRATPRRWPGTRACCARRASARCGPWCSPSDTLLLALK
ncbi:Methyltransferase OS=Streptomyces fumanus OX=67302 GN=GCM10018772_50480 PE=4 SV=1 [Streptomyces fumanus]